MVLKEPFINQEIIYIVEKGEMNCSTVTDYISEYLNIIEMENFLWGMQEREDTNWINYWYTDNIYIWIE